MRIHSYYLYFVIKIFTLVFFAKWLRQDIPDFSWLQIGILQLILGVGALASEFLWRKRDNHYHLPRIFKIMFWWFILDLGYLAMIYFSPATPETMLVLEYKFYVVQAILLIIVSTSAVYLYRI